MFVLWLLGCTPEDLPVPTPTPPPTAVAPALLINEVQSANRSTFGEDLLTPDWVELYNASDEDIDLARVTLADGFNQPRPVGEGVLAPGERRLVLSDSNIGDIPFDLDSNGGVLVLRVDDIVADELGFPWLDDDQSYARHPDGGDWAVTGRPTPDRANDAAPLYLDPRDALFNREQVWRIDLTITPQAAGVLNSSVFGPNRPSVRAVFSMDGMTYAEVGLRMKGSASADTLDGKPAFKIDFNEWDDAHRFRGLRGMNMNNGNVFDPTMSRDHLTYSLARDAGLPAPRVGWAELWINDIPMGLYVLQEDYDRTFLDVWIPGDADTSLLIEPNVVWFDFGQGQVSQLAQGIEVAPLVEDPALQASLQAIQGIVGQPSTDANLAELFEHVDRENLLNYTAWEGFVGHVTDGYAVSNNWRMIVRGSDARVLLVPSGAEWTWEQAPSFPMGGRLMTFCLANATCKKDVGIRMLALADRTEQLDLLGEFDALIDLLNGPLQDDTRRKHGQSVIVQTRQLTRENLNLNPDRARNSIYNLWPDLEP